MQKDIAVTDPLATPTSLDPDTQLRLDGEEDTLYDDGLQVDEEPGQLAGTHDKTPGLIKP